MQSAISAKVQIRYPWMFGKSVDLCFYFLPIILGFALYAATTNSAWVTSPFWAVVIFNAFGAGPLHQGATLFAYLDKANRTEFLSSNRKRIIFFVAPFLILGATILGAVYCYPLVIAVWTAWSLQHLTQQNVGILLLYHNHGKGEAIVPRQLEVKTLQWAAVTFAVIFMYRVMMKFTQPGLWVPVIAALSIYTAYLIVSYLINLNKQVKEGAYLNMPAFVFWIVSVLALTPMAFLGRSFEDGYLIPITVHWFQYLGLNYVLVQNKYRNEMLERLPVSKPILLFIGMCAVICVMEMAMSFGRSYMLNDSLNKSILVGALLGLGHVHYFLDAFLWRFREPYQRAAILPYLMQNRSA